jgi:hypothetical protein
MAGQFAENRAVGRIKKEDRSANPGGRDQMLSR